MDPIYTANMSAILGYLGVIWGGPAAFLLTVRCVVADGTYYNEIQFGNLYTYIYIYMAT